MKGRIWLGVQGNEQLLSAESRVFDEEDIEIAREGRTASGRLVRDITAVKKKFTLTYEIVTGTTLAQLKAIYLSGNTLQLKVEQQDTTIKEYKVVFRPFSRRRHLAAGNWLWSDITLELEEI